MIVDTHCHFDLYPNPKEVINELEKSGIITIGMTNLPSHFKMGYPHIKNLKKISFMNLVLHYMRKYFILSFLINFLLRN